MTNICPCEQGELRSESGQPGLSGKTFERCCERFLSGRAHATTPKQLMRSRYTAYALGNYGEYLLATWAPVKRKGLTAASLSEKSLDWVKLEILNSDQKGNEENGFQFVLFHGLLLSVFKLLEDTSKISFAPISLLEPRFKSSKYNSIPPV